MSRSPFMSPDDAAAAPVPVEAAVEVVLSFLSSPHAASSTPSAPAAPAPPTERRKRLRDESSRASSSSAPRLRWVSGVWSVIVSFLDEFGFADPYGAACTSVVWQARRRYCASVQRRRGAADCVALEDPEVLAHHGHAHVEDGHGADRSLERARVGVAVEHEVRLVLADGRRDAVVAEHRPDRLGLAYERLLARRVVQQRDADLAVRDRAQLAVQRLDVLRRLVIDAAQERLAEVGQVRSREAADEALQPGHPHLEARGDEDRVLPLEDDDPRLAQDRADLARA